MTLNEESLKKIIKKKVRQHTKESFQYFLGSLVLQIIVYALCSYVIIKHWGEMMITVPAAIAIILYVPFTVVFMNKFKSMAVTGGSVNIFVLQQHELLGSFYRFKKRYELVLIPVATLIGTFVAFEIWVPGGIWAYPTGAMITFLFSLASCIIAIQAENKKSFEQPLSKLQSIIEDLNAN